MMRKNGDWYEEDEGLSFVQNLLVKYSPVVKKDVIIAFQEFIDKFEKLEITWYEWEAIYVAGKSPEEVTKDILYPTQEDAPLPVPVNPQHKKWASLRQNRSLDKSPL